MLTYEKKIGFLRSATALKRSLSALTEEAEELESLAVSVSAVCMGDNARGSGRSSSRVEKAVEELEEIRGRVLRLSRRYAKQYKAVESVILSIPDGRDRTIFRLRYLSGLSWDDIAERLDLSERRVRQIHRRVLENLTLPDNLTDFMDRGG